MRRRWVLGGALALLACAGAGAVGWEQSGSGHPLTAPSSGTSADGYPGLPHTSVQISPGGCGAGWDRPQPGLQVFDLHNTGVAPEDAYVEDPATGRVLGEIEGLAGGAVRPMLVRLGAGSYAFQCLPQDTDAVTGPTVRVPGGAAGSGGAGDGSAGGGGPAVVPVTQQDLIPPTLAYQKWVGAQLPGLVSAVDVLRAAVGRGDSAGARAAWLPAHLDYERLGAAYGTFGGLDGSINGTTKGLPGGTSDPGFTGFHRLEFGLWHGESAASLGPVADRLAADVRTLQSRWAAARMNPKDLGLRAHEIVENTIQFELTGRTDYGSGSGLATAQANLRGTAEALDLLRPLLRTRMPELPQIDAALAATTREVAGLGGAPVSGLPLGQREALNAAFGDLVARLAPVAAVCDVRRTS
jgi:iron uptake system component EfeO